MDKEHLQQMFGQYKGFVYRYAGDIIPDVDLLNYITDQYAELAHNNIISTIVPTDQGYLFYTDHALESPSDAFVFICDLTPETREAANDPPWIDPPITGIRDLELEARIEAEYKLLQANVSTQGNTQ